MHIVECLTHSKIGGGQAVVLTLVRQLQKLHPQLRFTIMLPENGFYVERFKALGVDVEGFAFDSISPFRLFQLSKRLQALNPDVVHSHGKGAGVYARLLRQRRDSILRVHSYHGFHPPEGMSASIYRNLESYLLSKTDIVVAISQSEADEIRSALKNADSKIEVIPNVVDCEELCARDSLSLPSSLDSFLLKNSARFIVTMIGRNDPVKNYPLAFAAAEIVLKENQRVCFVFVGVSWNDAGCAMLAELFPDNVFVLPSLENPAPLIKRSAAVMLTSKKEGSPLVVQEAFCFGKPVVGTDVPGIRGVVEHGVNGILCSEDEHSIASAIALMESDHARYKGLSENARATVSKMNISLWAEEYYNVYLQRGT